MINKILLFGSTGMLGRYIYTYFIKHTKITIIKIEYRITLEKLDNLEKILIDNNIDENTCIINCIGLIPQRADDKNKKNYYTINSIFPHLLWNSCKKYYSKLIQPTTDCVFTGLKKTDLEKKEKGEGNYSETDIHDEMGDYGLSKSLGEPIGCTVIRTSIIGRELLNKKSFMEWVINSINDDAKITGWTNHYWNGITCLEYCKFIEYIIINDMFWSGVRHIYSPTSKSKYELACLIIKIFFEKYSDNNINMIIAPNESKDIINKTLKSDYNNIYSISELEVQINELKNFELIM